jgi:hypothetical protein
MKNAQGENKSIIHTYPTKELFISVLVRDVTMKDAIGDLLDNSVDGALSLRGNGDYKGLHVDIKINPGSDCFKITDNCGGIPIEVARDYAFRFGRPEESKPPRHSVGVFGIGMKRALFRLGKKFSVQSVSKNSCFDMEVDVEKWKKRGDDSGKPEDWQFNFSDGWKEKVKPDFPVDKRGTTITVTALHEDVKEAFSISNDITDLVTELQREHLMSMDKGLKIEVNGIKLTAPQLQLLASEGFKTAYFEKLDGPVRVKLYAGVSVEEKYGPNGGWYVFCNNRLVLGPDQTRVTGWGVSTPTKIPEYHSQFYRFRGYAFFDADDPRGLPWNTAKTNINPDSSVYRAVFIIMVLLMRSVIDFLNKLHDEAGHYQNGKIKVRPLKSAVDSAKVLSLSVVQKDVSNLSVGRFVFPKPAKPAKPIPTEVTIRYTVPKNKYDLVAAYFGIDNSTDIGLKVFDYFFQREIED